MRVTPSKRIPQLRPMSSLYHSRVTWTYYGIRLIKVPGIAFSSVLFRIYITRRESWTPRVFASDPAIDLKGRISVYASRVDPGWSARSRHCLSQWRSRHIPHTSSRWNKRRDVQFKRSNYTRVNTISPR
jgi:hypothetical protein